MSEQVNFDSNKLREEKEQKRQFALRAASYRIKKAWKAVCSMPEGKTVLHELLEEAKTYCSPYTSDPNLTHINIGRQDIGRHILQKIEECRPEALLEMIREDKADKIREENIDKEIDQIQES